MFDSKNRETTSDLTLEFEDPTKLKDGKYYSKARGKYLLKLHDLRVLGNVESSVPFEITTGDDKEAVKRIDAVCLNEAVTSSEKWFNKELSYEAIDSMLKRSIHIDDNHQCTFNPETFKNGDNVRVNVHESRNKKISASELNTGDNVSIVVQVYGIMFFKKSFSVHWKIHQIKVNRKKQKILLEEYQFQDDSSDEELS